MGAGDVVGMRHVAIRSGRLQTEKTELNRNLDCMRNGNRLPSEQFSEQSLSCAFDHLDLLPGYVLVRNPTRDGQQMEEGSD